MLRQTSRSFAEFLFSSCCSATLLLGLAGAAAATPLQDRLAAATKLIESGKPKAALKDLEKYVRDFPAQPEGWILFGRALHESDRAAEALEKFRHASQLAGGMPLAAYHAARACDRLEKLDEAFDWLDRAIETGFDKWALLRSDKELERCRADERFSHRVPFSLDPKKPFVEPVVVLHDLYGELTEGRFGWSAADMGDVDGDGVADFAVGAPLHTDQFKQGGKVYVFSGNNGREIHGASASDDELMGWSIGLTGDVNKDGKRDFWAAAPGQNGLTGALYVMTCADGVQLKRLPGQGTNDRFAEFVCPLGDLDGDGIDELVIAAPGNDANGEDCGRLYVASLVDGSVFATFEGMAPLDRLGGGGVAAWMAGKELRIAAGASKAGEDRKGLIYVWSSLEKSEPRILAGDAAARARAGRLSYALDFDGDGERDLFASDEILDTPSFASSQLWAWSGKSGELLLKLASPLSGDGFARTLAPVFDVDGDGRPELAIGAWRSKRGGPYAGGVTLHSGDAAAKGKVVARVTGGLAHGGIGFTVTPLSDMDGDRLPELLVSAPLDTSRGPRAGRVWVIAGKSLRAQAAK